MNTDKIKHQCNSVFISVRQNPGDYQNKGGLKINGWLALFVTGVRPAQTKG
jgi:hypothetical protein